MFIQLNRSFAPSAAAVSVCVQSRESEILSEASIAKQGKEARGGDNDNEKESCIERWIISMLPRKGQWPKKIDVTFVTCRIMNSATICSTTPRHYRGVRYARTDGAYYLLPIISTAHVCS